MQKLENVYIVGAARTPIGDFLGTLKDISAVDLGVVTAQAAMERAGVKPEQVNDVVAGMCYKQGVKGNPARQIQLNSGIPVVAPAATIDQQCGSAMRALEIAANQIMLGKSSVSLAVGIENMSQVPYLLMGARTGYRMGQGQVEDALLYDALNDAFFGYHMGVTAENLAEKYGITRQEQDELALLSHQRAVAAIREGKFKEEIVPVEVKIKKKKVLFTTDEHPRESASLDNLAKLRPAFKDDGTVTAGNASGVNDAAAAVILMSESKVLETGVKPLAKIIATASYGVNPEIMGIGPAYAIPKALELANLELNDIDYFEINEAFAAQFLAVNRKLRLNIDRVNANGSGIALGHPVGCTGIRLIVTLLSEMRRRGGQFGVASLCVGGGPAMATVVEMVN
ncbi:thiolase family protein [Pelotomaculum propionicicum]|uniref:thiolase family protein n=1 Tax=Pelotomaculum propionicicum TaxID=258475 RepID=UPI003B80F2EE